jgi:hypothetical protein
LVEPVGYANAFAATCSGSNINQDAGSSISLHDHSGDKTLQLRSTPAPEQATETIHFTAERHTPFLHIEKIPAYGESLGGGILLHP